MRRQDAAAAQAEPLAGTPLAARWCMFAASTEDVEDVLASDLVDDPNRSAAAEPRRAAMTARRRRYWGRQAALAAVTLGATGMFLAISRTISGHRGSGFDRAVVRRMGRVRSPVANALMRGVTFLGSAPGTAAVSLVAFSWVRKRPRLAWQVVSAGIGGASGELVFKRFFLRRRPTLLAHLERTESTSFPSGHSMASSAIYLTLAFIASRTQRLRRHRATLLAGAGSVAAAVGVTRVYLGVHWPTDVLGGIALGTAWACAAEAAFDLTGAGRVERDAGVPVQQPSSDAVLA